MGGHRNSSNIPGSLPPGVDVTSLGVEQREEKREKESEETKITDGIDTEGRKEGERLVHRGIRPDRQNFHGKQTPTEPCGNCWYNILYRYTLLPSLSLSLSLFIHTHTHVQKLDWDNEIEPRAFRNHVQLFSVLFVNKHGRDGKKYNWNGKIS